MEKCSKCGKGVSTDAKSCPVCHHDFGHGGVVKKVCKKIVQDAGMESWKCPKCKKEFPTLYKGGRGGLALLNFQKHVSACSNET